MKMKPNIILINMQSFTNFMKCKINIYQQSDWRGNLLHFASYSWTLTLLFDTLFTYTLIHLFNKTRFLVSPGYVIKANLSSKLNHTHTYKMLTLVKAFQVSYKLKKGVTKA